MIPYGKQNINDSDIEEVVKVLKSDWITQGPTIPKFEDSLALYCNAKHAVAVNSATSALHISCLALGVGKDDWVWTSATTFVASANCAIYCGAKVDFIDIDPLTYNLDVEALAEKLSIAKKNNRLPKVVIPVHLCGQSCNMSALFDLSEKYNFKIIEDASHAIGSKYKNDKVGNCRYSDITVFSFHPVKIITTGEGGIALTNDQKLANIMYRLRSHGITTDSSQHLPRSDDEIWNYQQIQLGYNYRMTDLQAALGLSQLSRLDEFIVKRHQISKIYDDAFNKLPIKSPWQHPDAYSSFHLYPIRINQIECGKTQKQVYNSFHEAGINVNLHYIPVYRHPFYEAMGFKAGYCPESESYHKEAISLPIFTDLSISQQQYVIHTLETILS